MKHSLLPVSVLSSLLFMFWVGCGSDNSSPVFTTGKDAGKDTTVGGAAGQAGAGGGATGQGGTEAGGTSGEGGSAGIAGTSGEGGTGEGGSGGELADVEVEPYPDVDFSYDAPTDLAQEACAVTNVEAKLKPLDMYFMIDRSGSMSGQPWTDETNAMNAFWTDPGSAGITAALRFFPYDNSCSPMDPTCSGNLYITPEVPWGVLPGNAAALGQAMAQTNTMGCTPTEEALKGLLKGSKQRQIQQPDHVVVGVIVSDGEPVGCEESETYLQGIAASFFTGTPPVRTFALYVASSASAVMNAIAAGGGTTAAYDATSTQQLIDALKAIQGSAIPCDFDMPVPEAGVVDPDEVTLTYQGSPILRVDGEANCGANGGWYFDDPSSPKKIFLCSSTCTLLKADPTAKVDVSLGCLGS